LSIAFRLDLAGRKLPRPDRDTSQYSWRGPVEDYARVESEMPSWCALTVVAPIVRFNAFEIFTTPAFFFASDFISRTSDEVHGRRISLFTVGILSSLF
jgi:hypothetical protein